MEFLISFSSWVLAQQCHWRNSSVDQRALASPMRLQRKDQIIAFDCLTNSNQSVDLGVQHPTPFSVMQSGSGACGQPLCAEPLRAGGALAARVPTAAKVAAHGGNCGPWFGDLGGKVTFLATVFSAAAFDLPAGAQNALRPDVQYVC